jgi:hypothetical protein
MAHTKKDAHVERQLNLLLPADVGAGRTYRTLLKEVQDGALGESPAEYVGFVLAEYVATARALAAHLGLQLGEHANDTFDLPAPLVLDPRHIDYHEAYRRADEAYRAGRLEEAEFFGRLWIWLLHETPQDRTDAPGRDRDAVFTAMYG